MNLKTNISKFIVLAFLALVILSCSKDDNEGDVIVPTNTIADFVNDNDNYTTLAAAFEAAGLISTLEGSENYTVFAPNDAAFNTFLSDNGFDSLEEVPESVLREILLNHIQEGALELDSLSTGYIESMATGMASEENLSMYINIEDGVWINGRAEVTRANIETDNGLIHAVDAVIGLPNVLDFAIADPTFNTLIQALIREDDYDFVDILQMTEEPAPLTLFAPDNNAFVSLFDELKVDELADIDTNLLAAALSYHIVTDRNVRSSELSDAMELETLQGESFMVNTGNEVNDDEVALTDFNERIAILIAADIQANNGVIHVLDTVMLPEMPDMEE